MEKLWSAPRFASGVEVLPESTRSTLGCPSYSQEGLSPRRRGLHRRTQRTPRRAPTSYAATNGILGHLRALIRLVCPAAFVQGGTPHQHGKLILRPPLTEKVRSDPPRPPGPLLCRSLPAHCECTPPSPKLGCCLSRSTSVTCSASMAARASMGSCTGQAGMATVCATCSSLTTSTALTGNPSLTTTRNCGSSFLPVGRRSWAHSWPLGWETSCQVRRSSQ